MPPPALTRALVMHDRSNDRGPSAQVEVRVHAPGEPSGEVDALMEWLARHEAVDSVRHFAASGRLLVSYDESKASERVLVGSIRDRLFAAHPPAPPLSAPLRVTIGHELPGRLRLRCEGDPSCVDRLGAFVAAQPGVERARSSPSTLSVLVLFDPKQTSSATLLDLIAKAPPSTWPEPGPAPPAPHVEWMKTAANVAVLAAAATQIVPQPILVGAAALNAIPPFKRAFRSLARGKANVDVLDAVAIAVSLAQSQPVASSVITTLLAVGDLILDRTQSRARTAISRLMQLDDGEAFLLDEGATSPRKVHPRELAAGVRIVVYPGSRIPADGVIVEGGLSVDEKALTGESVPRDCHVGDAVMAASVVAHGQAVVRVERAGGDTVAARIVQILQGAGVKPMTLQENVEKSADRLVLPTFAVAGVAYAATGMIDRLTSVLITDFGTGIRVGVPTAALAAMVEAARAGVLVKGAQFLERLSEADTIVFDKTGTLTMGVPEVVEITLLDASRTEREVVAFAAAAEGNQSHPIADAIRRHAEKVLVGSNGKRWEVEPSSESYAIGLGLRARVNGHVVHVGSKRMMRELGQPLDAAERALDALGSAGASGLIVAIDGVLAAVVGYADAPRPESAAVVRALQANGRRRVMLLSGDGRAPVEAIARKLGIEEAIAEVLPANKADVIRDLKARGRKVAMVGDGINDAPALAVADIGISLRGGTEVALETADVVLLEGGLERLPDVFALSDRAMKRVKQVVGIVLVPNAIAIGAGALGLLNPIAAAMVNNGSTVAAALHAIGPILRAQKPRG